MCMSADINPLVMLKLENIALKQAVMSKTVLFYSESSKMLGHRVWISKN